MGNPVTFFEVVGRDVEALQSSTISAGSPRCSLVVEEKCRWCHIGSNHVS